MGFGDAGSVKGSVENLFIRVELLHSFGRGIFESERFLLSFVGAAFESCGRVRREKERFENSSSPNESVCEVVL